MASSIRAPRVRNSSPSASYSDSCQPTPTPSFTTRALTPGAARASPRACGVEGRGDVAEVGGAVGAHGDGDDIEAARDLPEALPLEVVLGETDETPPLPPLDRGRRSVAPARLPALHLDEHPDTPVAADEVELAVLESHVARDDREPRGREEARRGVFGLSTERLACVGHASASWTALGPSEMSNLWNSRNLGACHEPPPATTGAGAVISA